MARFRRKTCVTLAGLVLFIFAVTVVLKSLRPEGSGAEGVGGARPHARQEDTPPPVGGRTDPGDPARLRRPAGPQPDPEPEPTPGRFPAPNYGLHAFYYIWYGSPQFDGKYIHWDHPVLPHWDPKVAAAYPEGRHSPPEDVGANFYPALGAYSSRDPAVIDAHMQQLRTAAIGVLAVSWYPPGMKDDNGEPTDDIVPLVLAAAHRYQVKVAFHIEPYKGRDDLSMYNSVKYIIETYGEHPAFYRHRTRGGKLLPLFYVYDSYLLSAERWAGLLKDGGRHSVRNSPFDGVFLALLVEEAQQGDIAAAGFDGLYTYFATNGFSYGSSHANWAAVKGFCERQGLLFVPSVGPGYTDTSVRPWNAQNTRNRIHGRYYETALGAALETRPDVVSITSFNEWHEGTQIERAQHQTGATGLLGFLLNKLE
ncbi:hypothetical protein AAFF_G00261210 [Aldrovandia affinis]|uniref:Glycoprotein endo-alpha-1,2-mannosidase n=1 Tax=Aldrovandia affinis TaxID=143900 RepID=A0AAD7RC40_9TELE|nr:hypothetical protein AAFF_G00261210 [Aldrovandia affinis]